MAITSGFFDSVSGDRVYNAEQMSRYFEGLISDGVFESVGNKFAVTSANDGMKVNVASGRAVIKWHWVQNDDTVQLTLSPADASFDRIDAIVLRLDTEAREITLTVKTGTPAASPQMPDITRNDEVYELYLASVLVKAGSSALFPPTDMRPSAYCGWVTGLITQVDTSTLFTQWMIAYQDQYNWFNTFIQEKTNEFNNWFSTLTQQLTVEAGMIKLQNVVTLTNPNVANVGIPEYDPDEDVLFVYAKGLFYTEGVDYEIIKLGSHTTAVAFNNSTLERGDKVSFIVLKNQIGKDVLAPVHVNPETAGINSFAAGTATFSEVE